MAKKKKPIDERNKEITPLYLDSLKKLIERLTFGETKESYLGMLCVALEIQKTTAILTKLIIQGLMSLSLDDFY